MGLIQKLFLAILPKSMADDMRADSKSWIMVCRTCGERRSVWDAGGIRWGAYSKGKRTLCFCTKCDRYRWASWERENPPVGY